MKHPAVGNILIVDDEELIRTTIAIKLEHDGYKTDTVASGEKALNALKSKSYDVVLTDLKMIGMDGIELLKQVKQIQPDIEVIILTGYASLESAIEALRNEAYDYLMKPLDDNKLRIVIKRCLEKKQLLKAIQEAEQQIKCLNRFYQSLLNHIDEAIFVVDHNLKLIDHNNVVNDWGQDFLGYKNHIERGMDFHDTAPRFCELGHKTKYHQVVSSGKTQQFEDIIGNHPHERHVLIRLIPIPSDDDKHRRIMTVISDITALKRLEAESLLNKKLEGITQAAITLNHEINNPLGIILGNTNLLMADTPESNKNQREKLEVINDQIIRISEFIRKLAEITQPHESSYVDDKIMIDMGKSS
jgi:PAS domain S-box-containing protein